jgi:hypothetical protein
MCACGCRAELTAARNGLKNQVLLNEKLKLRLAKLLRERFGAASEKLRREIEQLVSDRSTACRTDGRNP